MFEYSYIAGPVVGGVIGYITNALAIRMLFRPYKAKYICGIKVPFTPGIIPKEKGRIASSLGNAISENLMNNEVLERYLLSDEMITKLTEALDSYIAQQKDNEQTLHEYLTSHMSEADYQAALGSLKTELTAAVGNKLGDTSLGTQIAGAVVDHVSSKMRIDGLGINVNDLIGSAIGGRFGGVAGSVVSSTLGGTVFGKIADLIQTPLKKMLAKNINSMLNDKGADIVNAILTKEIDNITATPVKKLLEGRDEQIAQTRDMIINLYRRVITEQLPRILQTINIPSIIENRINEMDMRESEKVIFQVMSKELRAIIWLGAGLGMIMGCVNGLI